jgi:hypothetical protein
MTGVAIHTSNVLSAASSPLLGRGDFGAMSDFSAFLALVGRRVERRWRQFLDPDATVRPN